MPPDPNAPKKNFGDQLSTIGRHPVDFAKNIVKGELSGLAGGAIGGAIVAAPLAAYWARKPKEIGKKIIQTGANAPTYWKRLGHHLFELGKGETVGGGVIGLGLGGGKFFKKYQNDQQPQHNRFAAVPQHV